MFLDLLNGHLLKQQSELRVLAPALDLALVPIRQELLSPEQSLLPSFVGKVETAAAVHQPWPSFLHFHFMLRLLLHPFVLLLVLHLLPFLFLLLPCLFLHLLLSVSHRAKEMKPPADLAVVLGIASYRSRICDVDDGLYFACVAVLHFVVFQFHFLLLLLLRLFPFFLI